MAACVSGSVLSSLFYEHTSSLGDQEGLLLGQVVSHITDTISDSQINNFKEETITYVHAYLPCPGLFSWYNSAGCVVQDKLAHLLKDGKQKEVVGWYKFRRNCTLSVSLRERHVHRHLKETFPGISWQNFLLGLFTASATNNLSTHSYDHKLMHFNGRNFQNVPISVVNLGDTNQSDYKLHSKIPLGLDVGLYGQTIHQYREEFIDVKAKMHQVEKMHTMNSSLQQKLMDLCHSVSETEAVVGSLQTEVQQLREKWKSKQQIEDSKETLIDAPVTEKPTGDDVVSIETSAPESPLSPSRKKSHEGLRSCQSKKQTRKMEMTVGTLERPHKQTDSTGKATKVLKTAEPIKVDSFMALHTQTINKSNLVKASSEPKEIQKSQGEMVPHVASVNLGGQGKGAEDRVVAVEDQCTAEILKPNVLHKTEEEQDVTDLSAQNDKPKDAFSFVQDILLQAKSPSKQSSATLPRSSKPLQTSQSMDSTLQGQGARVTRSSTKGHTERSEENEQVLQTRSHSSEELASGRSVQSTRSGQSSRPLLGLDNDIQSNKTASSQSEVVMDLDETQDPDADRGDSMSQAY